jgi:D-xylose reductase
MSSAFPAVTFSAHAFTDYANEKECGQGVKRALDEGIVKREELFIVSKLWNTFHEPERVEPICRQQLEWWGIEYGTLP